VLRTELKSWSAVFNRVPTFTYKCKDFSPIYFIGKIWFKCHPYMPTTKYYLVYNTWFTIILYYINYTRSDNMYQYLKMVSRGDIIIVRKKKLEMCSYRNTWHCKLYIFRAHFFYKLNSSYIHWKLMPTYYIILYQYNTS